MNTPLEDAVAKRFGLLPNFFRLSSSEPKITENLWGFAQFAYLDNPLPSLFKERLFVYLSRFCDIRYCIARHVGFLIGLGYPAGDASCLPQTVESVVPLLRRHLPRGENLLPAVAVCAACDDVLSSFPAPDSEVEQALFACATHVFLQTPDAAPAHEALRRALGPSTLEQLNLFLAFVRIAHYWTKLHPELVIEEDVIQLLDTHEILADCILKDSEARTDNLSQHVGLELASLRELRGQHERMAEAFQELSVDHQYVKQSLYETEENLRELVSVMPAAVYACDRDGRITYCNRGMANIWGRMPDPEQRPWSFPDSCQVYGGDGIRLLPEDTPVWKVLATGEPVVNCELVVERSDVSRISILANITALRNSQGAVTGAVCIFQDITEFNRLQKEREGFLHELERSNRELSEFSYAVSHDLKAPIRNVRMLTQLLARRADSLPEDSAHLLNLIDQAAAGMDLLVESLLRYAQAGNGKLICEQVPVETIIESVRATLTPAIVKTRATVVWKPMPTVEADPILLEHLFQNLVANAIQYHRPGEVPMVEISAGLCGEEWQFSVKDNGQGIPSQYQNRVFEPLKRLHGSENPGSGLGLALCRTIVARHGGKIWVESEGAGKGTIFHFTLPVSQTAQSGAASVAGS